MARNTEVGVATRMDVVDKKWARTEEETVDPPSGPGFSNRVHGILVYKRPEGIAEWKGGCTWKCELLRIESR